MFHFMRKKYRLIRQEKSELIRGEAMVSGSLIRGEAMAPDS